MVWNATPEMCLQLSMKLRAFALESAVAVLKPCTSDSVEGRFAEFRTIDFPKPSLDKRHEDNEVGDLLSI